MKTRYLTSAEVAAHYRRSPKTLERWRQIGYGPRWVYARGGKQALYPVAEVERFDAELLEQKLPNTA